MRTKAGFSIDRATKRDLDALSFVKGEPKSKIVERGVEKEVAGLSKAERRCFEAARDARGEHDSDEPKAS